MATEPDHDPAEDGAHMLGLWVPIAGVLFILAVAFVSALLTNCNP